jgi:hypothetical protein
VCGHKRGDNCVRAGSRRQSGHCVANCART